MLVDGETIAVVFVEAVPGPEPHEPPAIVQNADDIALGKARLRANVLEPGARRLGKAGDPGKWKQQEDNV